MSRKAVAGEVFSIFADLEDVRFPLNLCSSRFIVRRSRSLKAGPVCLS
jgi:hypothetical protein